MATKVEMHDVVFASGVHLQDTYSQLKQQWFGMRKGLHVDAWMEVDGVDDYQVRLSDARPGPDEPRLFFINLGGYVPGEFGEAHRYVLVVAHDEAQAKHLGKAQVDRLWNKSHTDNLYDVDDCLPVDCVEGRFIHLIRGPHRGVNTFSDYLVLP